MIIIIIVIIIMVMIIIIIIIIIIMLTIIVKFSNSAIFLTSFWFYCNIVFVYYLNEVMFQCHIYVLTFIHTHTLTYNACMHTCSAIQAYNSNSY